MLKLNTEQHGVATDTPVPFARSHAVYWLGELLDQLPARTAETGNT
jgi:hypothetical protein